MSTPLTKADVDRLISEPSPQVRAELAGKLALQLDDAKLNSKELEIAHDIIRVMVRDVEVQVRQSLAYSLRRSPQLPHDIALRLANDVEQVALPILENSTVLTDADLISIIRDGSAAKQAAIAVRPEVSEKVSETLISEAHESAVGKLMDNNNARINEQSMTKAVQRFEASDSVKTAMVNRKQLPITVAERLVTIVSEQLRDHLMAHHNLSGNMASDILLRSRERSVINLASGLQDRDLERLVQQMHQNRRLTPSLVIRALCMGDLAFFEVAISVLANVPLTNARILIHDAGSLGLKSLYEKAGLPMRLFSAIRIALEVVHETELGFNPHALENYRSRVIERVLTQFEDLAEDDIDYLLDKLQVMSEVNQPLPV